MDTLNHRLVLKRVGTVLVVVGTIDICYMIYCIANGVNYSSSFNIFAVIAGVFLLRGSLRAASNVRWFAALLLSAALAMVMMWPAIQPFDLTLTQIRLNTWWAVAALFFITLFSTLLFWIVRTLGDGSVQAAQIEVGVKVRDIRIPIALGVGLVGIMVVAAQFLTGNETGEHAKAIARLQLGNGFKYQVTSIHVSKSSEQTLVSGTVTAWNNVEIREVPFQWEEH